ncbi:MAG: type II toxin-antitoxin system RelE/ParE family toxin [Acidobacteria bacterium]|nr:type II toxin-antitoxin system RelE/ParE family toxin [Acidobacteriota bacterium]
MSHQVIITPSAKADIFEINAWFLENYPDLAENWLWGISRAVTSLSKFPERCPISPESAAFDVIVRQLLYGKKPHIYRILYSIQDEKVFILRVRSTRQKNFSDE